MPDPKHPDPKQQDERKQHGSHQSGSQPGHQSGSQPGRRSPGGGKENPGNFANDPDRARKAGEKGGRSPS